MTNSKSSTKSTKNNTAELERSWISALVFSALAIAIVLTVAVVVNLAIGRVIHWDIVTVLGVIGFLFLTIGRKFKTV